MSGVKLQAHARSTMRRITNSVLSKQSSRLGTIESTFFDVRPSEKASCASSRQRQCSYGTNAQEWHAQLRLVDNALQMRCPKWNKHVLLDCFDDCPLHLEGAKTQTKRRRGRAVLPCHSGDGRGTTAGFVLGSSVQAGLAAHRTMLCLGLPHASVPSQRALHVHQLNIACCSRHNAAAQKSSSFVSDKIEWNSFEKQYDPKLQSMSGVC